RGGKGRRLAARLDEGPKMRPGDLPEVEPGEDDVAELQQPKAQPVAPRVLDVLDQPACDERREQARGAARVDAGAAGYLVGAELGVRLGQRVEHAERALHRAHEPDRWLSGARHR